MTVGPAWLWIVQHLIQGAVCAGFFYAGRWDQRREDRRRKVER